MASGETLTLRNGFKIAHGDFEEITERFRNLRLNFKCSTRVEIAAHVKDPSQPILQSEGVILREGGITDDDGFMGEATRNIAECALPDNEEAREEACPVFNFSEEHLLAQA